LDNIIESKKIDVNEYENTIIGKYLSIIGEGDMQKGMYRIFDACNSTIIELNDRFIKMIRDIEALEDTNKIWPLIIEKSLAKRLNNHIPSSILKYRSGNQGKQEKDIHCDGIGENVFIVELSFYGLDPNDPKSYSIEVKTTYNGPSSINNSVQYAKDPEIEGGKIKKSFYIFIYYNLPNEYNDIVLRRIQFAFLTQSDWYYLKKDGTEQSHSYVKIKELRKCKKLIDIFNQFD
jgi:hypothetical protein